MSSDGPQSSEAPMKVETGSLDPSFKPDRRCLLLLILILLSEQSGLELLSLI